MEDDAGAFRPAGQAALPCMAFPPAPLARAQLNEMFRARRMPSMRWFRSVSIWPRLAQA